MNFELWILGVRKWRLRCGSVWGASTVPGDGLRAPLLKDTKQKWTTLSTRLTPGGESLFLSRYPACCFAPGMLGRKRRNTHNTSVNTDGSSFPIHTWESETNPFLGGMETIRCSTTPIPILYQMGSKNRDRSLGETAELSTKDLHSIADKQVPCVVKVL